MRLLRIIFIISNTDCKDPTGVFWHFSEFAFKTKGILTLFDLADCVSSSVINFQFNNDGIIAFNKWIKNKINITYTGFIFAFNAISIQKAELISTPSSWYNLHKVMIQAKNEYALKSSVSQLKGSVLKAVREIREKIIYHIAYIESALDDPEHISLDGYSEKLAQTVEEEKKKIRRLADSFDEGKMIREGIRTVIVGKPNAGKSSLLNYLVGEEKAIVTDIAGTTRDVLEETIVLQGISLRMMDTAGIRATEDVVEKIGVERARAYAKDADLVLYVVDSSIPLDENDEEILEILRDKKAIILLNKSDLTPVVTKEMLEARTDMPVLAISARQEQGVELLEEQIKSMFFAGELSFNDEVYITNVRHKTALEEAYQSLTMVEKSIAMEMPEDFFSIDLMNAYEALGRIVGESVGEDLVNEIFSKFCTGK